MFVVIGLICLLALGRAITPAAERQPVRTWDLDDYGTHLRRGLGVFVTAGQRNRYRMDLARKQATRHPDRPPEGLAILRSPADDDRVDPRRPDEDGPNDVDPDRRPFDPEGPDDQDWPGSPRPW